MVSKRPIVFVGIAALTCALAAILAWDGVTSMVHNWRRDEYSYGYLVPFLIAFFIWQKKHELVRIGFRPAWSGVFVALLGLSLILFGELSTLYVMVQYGFVVTLHGIALTALGWPAYRLVMVPLILLFFAVPLPQFLYNNLSQSLQLTSSAMGVWLLRLLDISVFLEGNVIHLADLNLHVAEACSGLRYLFPLVAVGFMIAYLYRAPLWKKGVVFLSTVPITVFMNSLRIGLIGASVEYWGPAMAEGVLHGFEGWVIFMGSVSILLAEMWILNQVASPRRSFQDAFYIHFPGPLPKGANVSFPAVSGPMATLVICLLCGIAVANALPRRPEVVPERKTFAQFPERLGSWSGQSERLDNVYTQALKFDDYLFADFVRGNGDRVNLYVAYYASQRKGASVHSPRSCIPGDGWEIANLRLQNIDNTTINGKPLRVNRVVIEKGDATQLVYYWFQQRGRVMTNEYLVKWYLFQDALTRHRTDGALVRLTTSVTSDRGMVAADKRLSEMARLVAMELGPYIPD